MRTNLGTLTFLLLGGLGIFCINPPEITISRWMEIDESEWKTGSEMEIQGILVNKTVYTIPGDIIGLEVSCTASYPIEWVYVFDEHRDLNLNRLSISAMGKREVGDVDNPRTFTYSMTLALRGETNLFTGKYVCKLSQENLRKELSTTIYLFWEGNSPPYLITAGKNITVSSDGKRFVRLPCQVSLPETIVYLQHEVNVTKQDGSNKTELSYMDMTFNTKDAWITFDATYGFMLDASAQQFSNGKYKCFTDEMEDWVQINVVPEPYPSGEPYKEVNYIFPGATLTYNSTARSLVCCSNSPKAPKIISLYCDNVVTCNIMRPVLHSGLFYKYGFHFGVENGNCIYQPVYFPSGLMRCFGDGIDVTRTPFSVQEYADNGTAQAPKIYWSWNDITAPQRLIQVLIRVVPKAESNGASSNPNSPYGGKRVYYRRPQGVPAPLLKSPLYAGQNVSFYCSTPQFYFSIGVRWIIRWKNSTVKQLDKPPTPDQYNQYYRYGPAEVPIYVVLDTGMDSITCLAPVWNSTDWVRKSVALKIRAPTLPTIEGSVSESVSWTLNDTDKSITCTGQGDPMPRITWTRNGKELTGLNAHDKKNMEVKSLNGSSTVAFKIVEYSIHGDYICTAENFADNIEKLFHVYVEEAHPWGITIAIICVSIVLVTMIGLLAWRLKVNRTTVLELRSAARANVNTNTVNDD